MSTTDMKLFPVMSSAQYNTRRRYYLDGKGRLETAQFYEFAVNAVARAIHHGRYSDAEIAVSVAKQTHRMRSLVRIIKSIMPWKWDDETQTFNPTTYDKKKRLKMLAKDEETGAFQFELLFQEHLNKEGGFQKKASKQDWSLEAAVLRLVKTAAKHESSIDDIRKALDKAAAKVA